MPLELGASRLQSVYRQLIAVGQHLVGLFESLQPGRADSIVIIIIIIITR